MVNYSTSDGDVTVVSLSWQMEDYQDKINTTGAVLPAYVIGPLHRNTTYTTTVKIHTELTYTHSNGSLDTFPSITEACSGGEFAVTEWPCANGEGSVPWSLVCDDPFAPDCVDGSDEAKLLCTGGDNNAVIVGLAVYFVSGIIVISFGKYQF